MNKNLWEIILEYEGRTCHFIEYFSDIFNLDKKEVSNLNLKLLHNLGIIKRKDYDKLYWFDEYNKMYKFYEDCGLKEKDIWNLIDKLHYENVFNLYIFLMRRNIKDENTKKFLLELLEEKNPIKLLISEGFITFYYKN